MMTEALYGLRDLVQIDAAEHGNRHPEAQSERHPVAERFPEFSLTSHQGCMTRPDSL